MSVIPRYPLRPRQQDAKTWGGVASELGLAAIDETRVHGVYVVQSHATFAPPHIIIVRHVAVVRAGAEGRDP